MKVFCAAFMCSQSGFIIFGGKDFGAKAVNKMLVRLTPGFSTFQRHSSVSTRSNESQTESSGSSSESGQRGEDGEGQQRQHQQRQQQRQRQ